MDLTVEIHGEAASLEECLGQFTVKEWLHGENMYKCDGYGFLVFVLVFVFSPIYNLVLALSHLRDNL